VGSSGIQGWHGFTAHGICRFYLKGLSPEVEVYVTPVNIDPGHPICRSRIR